ncbi:uncharacterized protein NEMAJ01_1138 [Nematocida major]|uniref:uncharacterized protein n=1 Tax=Nematocida major TaxID=1912982 RepID=UPI0020085CA1|nr:uncharacterized protein NEMAJ01_1138 [Nematocida major]KAH9386242.1 hypothetical protein NEMAJ01_1138 [Nematocida major]
MGEKKCSMVKNLILHSALLELYYKQRKHVALEVLLDKASVLLRFTLVEVICAKICSSIVIGMLPQYTSLEIFFTSCIIFKKYWNDFSLRNLEEVDKDIVSIKKLNRIEVAILKVIKYNIRITREQIQREIDLERSIDVTYNEAMSSILCTSK